MKIKLNYDPLKGLFFLENEKNEILYSNKDFFNVVSDEVFENNGIIKDRKINWSILEDGIFGEDPIHGVNSKDLSRVYLSKPFSPVLNNLISIKCGEYWKISKMIKEIKNSSLYIKEKLVVLRGDNVSFHYTEDFDYDYKNFNSLDEYFKKELKKRITKNFGKIIKIQKINDSKYYLLIDFKKLNVKTIYCLKLNVVDNVYGFILTNEATGRLENDCSKELLSYSDMPILEAVNWRKNTLQMVDF